MTQTWIEDRLGALTVLPSWFWGRHPFSSTARKNAIKSRGIQNVKLTAEGEGIWPMWFLTSERNEGSYITFVDTIFLEILPAWNQTGPNGKCKWVATHPLIHTVPNEPNYCAGVKTPLVLFNKYGGTCSYTDMKSKCVLIPQVTGKLVSVHQVVSLYELQSKSFKTDAVLQQRCNSSFFSSFFLSLALI